MYALIIEARDERLKGCRADRKGRTTAAVDSRRLIPSMNTVVDCNVGYNKYHLQMDEPVTCRCCLDKEGART